MSWALTPYTTNSSPSLRSRLTREVVALVIISEASNYRSWLLPPSVDVLTEPCLYMWVYVYIEFVVYLLQFLNMHIMYLAAVQCETYLHCALKESFGRYTVLPYCRNVISLNIRKYVENVLMSPFFCIHTCTHTRIPTRHQRVKPFCSFDNTQYFIQILH